MTDRETAEHNPRAWFAYDPLEGVSFFATEAEARAQAEAWLDEERDWSVDGWSEEVEGICYGLVTGYVVQTKNEPAPEGSEFHYIADYALRDAARASAPPSPGLVDSRLTELARTDATVAATLKHHANGVPLVEALTACVIAIAEHNRAMYKLAIDVVMTQPPASIVIHGAPGLVEAARNLSMELEDWFGMDCESAPPAITETFNVLRAALPKEPTNG